MLVCSSQNINFFGNKNRQTTIYHDFCDIHALSKLSIGELFVYSVVREQKQVYDNYSGGGATLRQIRVVIQQTLVLFLFLFQAPQPPPAPATATLITCTICSLAG